MSDNTINSYEEFIQPTAGSNSLTELTELAIEQLEAEAEVARLTAELEAATKKAKHIAESRMPAMMEAVGMKEMKLANGMIIEIEERIHGSIPKAQLPAAHAWLRENGHASLIKNEVKFSFGRGEDELRDRLFAAIDHAVQTGELPKRPDMDVKEAVNHQTLNAFVREQLKAGRELPVDLIPVHRQPVAKVRSE
jgi:hypothetical protein